MKNFCTSSLRQKLKFSSLFFGRIEDTKISFRDQLTFTNWISARKCTYFLSLNRILFHLIELSNANSSMSTTYKNKSIKLNPNWHEAGRIYPPYIFGLDFVSWFFIKHIQTFLEVKIEINGNNLKPCQALYNLLLGGANDEHFSYFHSSCQLGLKKCWKIVYYYLFRK